MGLGASMQTGSAAAAAAAADKLAEKKNRQIEELIEQEKVAEIRTIKLLLLGAAESGKSTFAKQMKIIHRSGFTEDERMTYRQLIHSNTIQCITEVLAAMKERGFDLSTNDLKMDENMIWKYSRLIERGEMDLTPEVAEAIASVWKDITTSTTDVIRSSKEGGEPDGGPDGGTGGGCLQISDAAEYLMRNLERFSHPMYIPTDQDVLHVRLPTTGVIETCFNFKGYKFRMFDVGGQRSERRKWIHVFDNVTTIIFTVAMSCYDQLLREDSSVNAMHESIALFSSICNHKYFTTTPTILFLNKKDIFQTKIKSVSIKFCFPDYTGASTYEEASEYLRKKITRVNRQEKEIYSHFTNATDTQNINFVFDTSMSIVLQENLKEAGMF